MTPVPLAPAAVQGLVNLRGQIITAIDMRTLLAMTQKDDEEPPMNVVMRENSEVISLLVDSIGDVLEVSGEEYEAAPDTIPHYLRSIVSGLFKLEEGLLLVVGDVLAATSDKIERQ
jgi:purine-binding chemotaxis protein CheW